MTSNVQTFVSGKKERITGMFNDIANHYDFLNTFMSLGIDKLWRRNSITSLQKYNPQTILDLATGTGELAIEAARQLKPQQITGIDISSSMLRLGKEKINKKGLTEIIRLQEADSEALPFSDNSFDAVMVAFGVRNFENLQVGLREMYRVLKPGGIALILELSIPERPLIRRLYNLYFSRILPFLGRLFAHNYSAYAYLPSSVKSFPSGEAFLDRLKACGFKENKQITYTAGIASVYMAQKLAL